MNHKKVYAGYTLLELMITIFLSSIIILSIQFVMVDTQRSWSDSYAKVHGGAVSDSLMARTAFEKIVRKSSKTTHRLISPTELKLYYYGNWENSTVLDRTSRFYLSDTNPSELYVEHANIEDGDVYSTVQLASHVTDLEFRSVDDGYMMKLSLDDGRETISIVTTAIMHN